MQIRQQHEEFEQQWLSPMAARSSESKGRLREEAPCDIRTAFQRDRDRIIHSKAFRRLKHKTQVFIAPEGDHYRTRLTHTLEVAQIGRTIARALKLNEDLTEAIALGHDLGHTPFGHAGEDALDAVSSRGFRHYEHSLRVVDVLEDKGHGLNLSWEVRDGILNHPTKGKPGTMEGKIIRLSDKIAYINHDIDDAIRGRILQEDDLPREHLEVLGRTTKERIDRMIHDIIQASLEGSDVLMSGPVETSMKQLRKFMFQNVYIGSKAKEHEDKAMHMLMQLYSHFMAYPQQLPEEYRIQADERGESIEQAVTDYIAGMTDRYAINLFTDLFVPATWKG